MSRHDILEIDIFGLAARREIWMMRFGQSQKGASDLFARRCTRYRKYLEWVQGSLSQ
jgi:hypothetical protein